MSYKTGFYKGRLGIGLSNTMGMGDGNPRFPLDINGDIRITGSIVNEEGKAIISGSVGGGAMAVRQQNTTEEPSWTDNAITVENIDGNLQITGQLLTDGNVGIGTTSPSHLLTVGPNSTSNTGGTTSMAILGPGENADAILYFGTQQLDGTVPASGNAKKAAIIAEGITSYSRSKLHFCLDNTLDNSSTYNASLSNSRMTIQYDGNVGIGTTSPDHKLHIDGGNTGSTTFNDVVLKLSGTSTNNNGSVGMLFNMREGASGAKSAIFSKDYAGTWNRSSLVFCTNNSTNINDATLSDAKMVIRETGKVGIGTTAPNTNLHIEDRTDNTGTGDGLIPGLSGNTANHKPQECLRLTNSYSYNGNGPLLRFTNYHASGSNPSNDEYNLGGIAGYDVRRDWGGGLCFFTAPNTSGGGDLTARMVIDDRGYVGIGTTSPDAKLEVNGDLNIEATNDNWNTSVGKGLYLRFYGGTVNKGYIQSIDRSNSDENFPLLFYASTYTFNSTSGQVAIDSGGNVGIGTTSPTTILTIKKPIDSSAYGSGTRMIDFKSYFPGYNETSVKASIYCGVSDDGSLNTQAGYMAFMTADGGNGLGERMRIERTGNVGIGMTGPLCKLQVEGRIGCGGWSSDGNTSMFCVANDTNWGMKFLHSGSQYYTRFGCYGTGDNNRGFQFYDHAYSSVRMFINGAGNVGIGTTNPRSRLDVIHTTTDIVGDYQDTGAVLNIYGGVDKRCINIVTGNHAGTSTHHRYPALVFHPTRDNNIQHEPGGSIEFTDRPGGGTYSEQVRQTDIFIRTSARHSYNRILRDVCTISADGYVRGINAFQNDSDDRIKHNEKNINEGLNVINKLQAKEYFKTSTLFDENGNIYDSNHNFDLNNEGLPIDASGEVLTDVNKEIGFIAQEVFEIDELKHAVQEGDLVPDASGNMYKTKFGLCYEEIFVMNVVATQELDKKIIAIEDNNNLQINNTENIIGNIPFVNGYTIVNDKKLYNNNISDKLYFNPETGKLNCPNIESTYYGDGSNLQGIATESQINDLIEENKKLKQDNENNKELINFWTQQAMNLNNKLTTMENELKLIKENLGL